MIRSKPQPLTLLVNLGYTLNLGLIVFVEYLDENSLFLYGVKVINHFETFSEDKERYVISYKKYKNNTDYKTQKQDECFNQIEYSKFLR